MGRYVVEAGCGGGGWTTMYGILVYELVCDILYICCSALGGKKSNRFDHKISTGIETIVLRVPAGQFICVLESIPIPRPKNALPGGRRRIIE